MCQAAGETLRPWSFPAIWFAPPGKEIELRADHKGSWKKNVPVRSRLPICGAKMVWKMHTHILYIYVVDCTKF